MGGKACEGTTAGRKGRKSLSTATALESLRHEPIGSELLYNFAYLVSLGRRLAQGTRLCTGVSAHTPKQAPDKGATKCKTNRLAGDSG